VRRTSSKAKLGEEIGLSFTLSMSGRKSTKLRSTKINTPKLMIQPAAKGCARSCHRGLNDDQPHAAIDSSGSVPTQNAVIMAMDIIAFGAEAAANTNR